MQSFKLSLTFAALAVVMAFLSGPAGAENKPAAAVMVPADKPADTAPATPAPSATAEKPTQYIGYSWPFGDKDLNAELGQGPIVLELFSTQACIFCPVADRFFSDLMEKSPVIGLSCHVSYLDVKTGGLGKQVCTDRQYDYGKNISGGAVYTPQIVVNGRRETFGFSYDKVYKLLIEAAKAPPAAIGLKKKDGHVYEANMPSVQIAEGKPVSLKIIQYLKPTERVIPEGPNVDIDMHYVRVVSSITTQDWTKEKAAASLDLDIAPDENAAGAVVLLQNADKILAAGELVF